MSNGEVCVSTFGLHKTLARAAYVK